MRSRLAVFTTFVLIASIVNFDVRTIPSTNEASANPVPTAQSLTLPVRQAALAPADIAAAYLVANAERMGLSAFDVSDLVVTDVVRTEHSGATTVYFQQRFRGIDVFGALTNVIIGSDGSVAGNVGTLVPGLQRRGLTIAPRTSFEEATVAASSALDLAPSKAFVPVGSARGTSQQLLLTDGGISKSDIPIRLVFQQDPDGMLKLAWELTIEELDGTDWWQIRVDAASGVELDRNNLIASDSYTVYQAPVEAPSFGPRTVVVNPADPAASPFGWHDTDGVAGAESNLTQGNNVVAYTDTNGDNIIDPGSQPDGGVPLVFDFPIDLQAAPTAYKDALVTNLFYWNNVMHDIFYAYGFNEAAGNFQVNNYGNGGAAADAVQAEALDSTDLNNPQFLNNANFATPPDGTAPRMQMFRWTAANPDRGSSFDSGIIAHEYGHGVSNRLTGGPNNVACLAANESPGEGWSDFFALVMTMKPGDAGVDARPIGTYLIDETPAGVGIRTYPYTTNLGIDPRTYDEIKTASVPHGVGSVFTTMLWEMTWSLIDRDGFDPDLIGGTGGNITAIQLVIDALKLQPCNPGFVDARDSLLLADSLGFAGTNECLIWEAFAKRGLGYSATQGLAASRLDGTEAFDLPPQCRDLQLNKSVNASQIASGAQLIYTLDATNNSASPLTGVTITDAVPAGTTFADGSADCGGSESGGVVTFPIGVLNPGATATCSFVVTVDLGPISVDLFTEDFEAGTAAWTISHGVGTTDWVTSAVNPHSQATSMFAANIATTSDQMIETAAPTAIGPNTVLRFWHSYDTELGWDGGVVEVSTDGTIWTDAGAMFTQNGYPVTLNSSPNPLSARQAFSGNSAGYIESVVDLSSFSGSSLYVRFRFGTDSVVGMDGWHIDDVRIVDEVRIDNSADAVSKSQNDEVSTVVVGHGLLRVTTVPAVPSQISLDGIRLDRWGIDWMKLTPGSYEVCFSDIEGWQTPQCSTAIVTTGTTTTVDGTFTRLGNVRVTTNPGLPATISVDGVPADDWEVWVDMTAGPHTICYGDVADFITPACEVITVVAGAPLQTVTGNYAPSPGAPGPNGHGLLRVSTNPAVASQISVDGIVRDTWGLNWVKMPPGSYEICFSDAVDFVTPPCKTTVVAAGQTSTVNGQFVAGGYLQVITDSPHPSTIFVDGFPRDDWGIWTDIAVGDHLVCFGEDAGFAPPCQSVTLLPGGNSPVTGTWPP
ncbi:MAG: DUF11 domain-containing protein [Actinobacteria bacterium]|nr:DUF11 domain-containing protein [Actinomycetota bacterium]